MKPHSVASPPPTTSGLALDRTAQEARRIISRLSLAAWGMVAIVGILLPGMNLKNGLDSQRLELQIEAQQLADSFSQKASRDPDTWQYQLNAVQSELQLAQLRHRAHGIRLLDEKGRVLAESGAWSQRGVLTEQSEVSDSGKRVGLVVMQSELLHVLAESVPTLLGSLLAAALTWWLMVKVALNSLVELIKRLRQVRDEADSARAASRAKSEFLATMSHEIRTPMNGVLGMNELLLGSMLNAQQMQWAQAVQASGQHLLGVINDILDFSKIESGSMELEEVDFSLEDVVEKAVAMFSQQAEAKGLELASHFTPHDAPFALRGDPLRLSQALANLLGNAIKFTESGEVVVGVSLLDESELDAGVRVSVKDTGIGIAPEALERIFDQFAQADGSTRRAHGGTGLGLTISRRLLELMGGTLTAASQPGVGSTFTIDLRLPLARDRSVLAPRSNALEGVRVLIVDDNQTNREILLQLLRGWRMHVRCAESGQQALSLIDDAAHAGRPFDLAVLDMHMPKMDGLQLAQAIRSTPARAVTRLVMLSSTYCAADVQVRQQAGVLRWLNKPVRRADLKQALAETVAGGQIPPLSSAPRSPRSPAVPALRGHVLLVEDNPINQAVAKAMLDKMGVQVTVADDGAQGVDRVRHQSFDLVLMDCQMPVMDGFEATSAIRGLPDGRGLALPILALTANAMSGDEQACLDAGMNGFLAKPYTQAELRGALAQWLALAPVAADVGTETSPMPLQPLHRNGSKATDRSGPALDPQAIEALRHLEEPGSHALVTQLVNSFLASADSQFARLNLALSAGEAKAMSQLAHTLKSSAANLGAESLAACYHELEQCGREVRLEAARPWLDAARVEQQRALTALRELLEVPA